MQAKKKKNKIVSIIISISIAIVLLFGAVPILSSLSSDNKSSNSVTTNTSVSKGSIEITENGVHDVKDYDSAEVNVPIPAPVLQEKVITENGVVTPDEGFDGLSKVIVKISDGKTLNIILPEHFVDARKIYYIKIDDNKLLFSKSNEHGTNNYGLWLYCIDTNEWNQIYNECGSYSFYKQMTGNIWIISSCSGYNRNSLLYDSETNSISVLSGSKVSKSLQLTENKYLFYDTGNSGLFLYNTLDNSFKTLTSEYLHNFHQVDENRWLLCSGTNYEDGVYLLDLTNDSVIPLYTGTGRGFSIFKKLDETRFIIGSTYSTNSCALIYDSVDNTCEKFYTAEYYYNDLLVVSDNEILFLSNKAILFNMLDNTTTELYSGNSLKGYFKISDTKYILGPGNLQFFSSETKSITPFSSVYFNSFNIHKVSETEFLIGGGRGEILLYDAVSDEVTSLYKTVSDFVFDGFESAGNNNYYITSSFTTMKLFYDSSTKKVSVYSIEIEL